MGWPQCFNRNLIDDLDVPNVGNLKATMITGYSNCLCHADIGYTGTELQEAINGDKSFSQI